MGSNKMGLLSVSFFLLNNASHDLHTRTRFESQREETLSDRLVEKVTYFFFMG